MAEGITLVGYADDIAIVGRARTLDQLEGIVNESLKTVNDWMVAHQLKLAVQKTEAVMVTRKKGYQRPTFMLGGEQITTKKSIRYLGVDIDSGRRFKEHEALVGAKAMKTAQALSRILPNVGGSSTSKRKLLTSVVHSQLLYAAPIWEPLLFTRAGSTTTIKGDAAKHMKAAQILMAIRITRAYRTVSYEAAILLASIPPITLLAKERTMANNAANRAQALKDARKDTMTRCRNGTQ